MYIKTLSVENFRTFKNRMTVKFNDGLNVMVGHNNAGKTTIIRALEILFNSKRSRNMNIDDFSKKTTIKELQASPPTITINAILKESLNEPNYSEDLVVVASWLTKLQSRYEASITYEYYLPETETDNYYEAINEIKSDNPNEYWNEIEHNFLQKYKSRLLVGPPENQTLVDSEDIDKFDFQYLTAIRDVERDLYTGKNTLLKEVIDFFIDYDIKSDTTLTDKEKTSIINGKKKMFSQNADELLKSLHERMEEGKSHMLRYVQNTGAGFSEMKPTFEGSISDTELYSALRLIVQDETGITLPAINNGLGYNNLIYISLLLAKMQKDTSDEYLGSNSKVYSILAIEEPEAHLHPHMQYKFLKFLKENRKRQVRQVFITTHSPNITAAVDLEDIIVLYNDVNKKLNVGYPGKVFDEKDSEDLKSKKYIKRFLDVTKADLFFAQSIVLVEGLAEQLLVPEFAKSLNPEKDLVENHTSVINIGGRYFDHFLKIFDTNKSDHAINKKVVCITDLDPMRKNHARTNWEACLPLFLYKNEKKYDYKSTSNNLVNRKISENILISSQQEDESCTLEYDIILHNLTNKTVVVSSMSNKDEIFNLMDGYIEGKSYLELISLLRNGKFKEEAKEIEVANVNEDWLKRHLIAGRYLGSIKKGESAQDLALILFEELEKQTQSIICPEYLEKAIIWLQK